MGAGKGRLQLRPNAVRLCHGLTHGKVFQDFFGTARDGRRTHLPDTPTAGDAHTFTSTTTAHDRRDAPVQPLNALAFAFFDDGRAAKDLGRFAGAKFKCLGGVHFEQRACATHFKVGGSLCKLVRHTFQVVLHAFNLPDHFRELVPDELVLYQAFAERLCNRGEKRYSTAGALGAFTGNTLTLRVSANLNASE